MARPRARRLSRQTKAKMRDGGTVAAPAAPPAEPPAAPPPAKKTTAKKTTAKKA